MKVKIKENINSLPWYSNYSGTEFEVEQQEDGSFKLLESETDRINGLEETDSAFHIILKDDCDILA